MTPNGNTRPVPARLVRYGVVPTIDAGRPVFTIAAASSLPDHVGWAWRAMAATPATCGDAMDVPERPPGLFPLPFSVEKMLTPGAVTFGLRKLSPFLGPPDVKLASP